MRQNEARENAANAAKENAAVAVATWMVLVRLYEMELHRNGEGGHEERHTLEHAALNTLEGWEVEYRDTCEELAAGIQIYLQENNWDK